MATDEEIRLLAEKIGARLAASGKTAACAESCTGGLVCSLITDVPGASSYFSGGCVVYVNSEKIRQLGVSPETLATDGPVSEKCAIEMAVNLRRKAKTDFAVSTTGYAGPSGGADGRPVGTAFVGVASKDSARAQEVYLPGLTRGQFKKEIAFRALKALETEAEKQQELNNGRKDD